MIIVGQEKPSPAELAHFGVKGMKWGVRRDEPTNSKYSSADQAEDREAHGKRGVKRINRNLNKGLTREDALGREERRDAAQRLAILGALLVGRLLITEKNLTAAELFIKNKAASNRAAARLADGALQLGSKANPLKYIKPKRGTYNITTMK